jgi:hypothetical protein
MLKTKEIKNLEHDIDTYIIKNIDINYPLYKYIYHLNISHISYIVNNNLLFTLNERHINFSLTANTYWAYKILDPENSPDFSFDNEMYLACYENIHNGFKYSILCDEFPKVNSNLSQIEFDSANNTYSFISHKFPRQNIINTLEYTKRNTLKHLLDRIIAENASDADSVVNKLTYEFCTLLAEQLNRSDFTKYRRRDWISITRYIVWWAMNGYVAFMNKEEVNIPIIHPSSFQSISSMLNLDLKTFNDVIEDYIYKPVGKDFYPKCTLSDAPIIKTNLDYLIINPFIVLSNHIDTRHLSYMRKLDNNNYTLLKGNICERHLKFIIELISKKLSNISIIRNFYVQKKNSTDTREVDLLIFDNKTGDAIYIEVKYYYNPISFSETKSLDESLNTALEKISYQLDDIRNNWSSTKQKYNLKKDLSSLNGILLSYDYLGLNLPTNNQVPLINRHVFYKSILSSTNLVNLFIKCKENESMLNSKLIDNSKVQINFNDKNFILEMPSMNSLKESIINHHTDDIMDNYLKVSKEIDQVAGDIDEEYAANIMLKK